MILFLFLTTLLLVVFLFSSNLTSSFLDLDKNCSGTVMNATLSGRDVVMIQKRIFGGLKISQPFIDWATIPGFFCFISWIFNFPKTFKICFVAANFTHCLIMLFYEAEFKFFRIKCFKPLYYLWETPLEHLFLTRPDFKERRQTKHNIVCYHDALFHPNKGLVGVRIEFVENVLMENIEIDGLYNGGDDDHFLCKFKGMCLFGGTQVPFGYPKGNRV
jgi:hypothetical protein